MSQGEALPFERVAPLAAELLHILGPACDRSAVAGSLRRHKPLVHDIEIVAIPHVEEVAADVLFADHAEPVRFDHLALALGRLREAGTLVPRAVEVHRRDGTVEVQERDGAKYKALAYRGVSVDLFLATPETWGVIYALRTGPGDWNEQLVKDCKRYFRRVEKGRVLHLGQPVETPEERDFFEAIGQPWIEPADRHISRVAIRPPSLGSASRGSGPAIHPTSFLGRNGA